MHGADRANSGGAATPERLLEVFQSVTTATARFIRTVDLHFLSKDVSVFSAPWACASESKGGESK
jgi:hypothetical protein